MKTSVCTSAASARLGTYPAAVSRRHALRSAAAFTLWAASAGALRAQAAPALLVMAGAGYKRPVEDLCAAFTKATGVMVERSYGNLQQVIAQAKASGGVDVLVGDASLIDTAHGLALPRRVSLGQGILTLAWRRQLAVPTGLTGLAGVRQILAQSQWSCALPNPQQAIYGNAAKQLLQAQGLWEGVQARLKVVGTVPQVSAYLISGEVDVGFMNLTQALAVKDQLGGFIQLPSGAGSYSEVAIVAAMSDASNTPLALENIEQFALFLGTPGAQAILRRAGL